jgi:hypothetical protein
MAMRRVTLLFLCLAPFLTGCFASNRYKAEIKTGMKELNELHFTYKKINNKLTAETGAKQIREVCQRLKEQKARIDEAEPNDEKVKQKVLDTLKVGLEPLLNNIKKELGRFEKATAASIPAEILDQTKDLIREYEALLPADQ